MGQLVAPLEMQCSESMHADYNYSSYAPCHNGVEARSEIRTAIYKDIVSNLNIGGKGEEG